MSPTTASRARRPQTRAPAQSAFPAGGVASEARLARRFDWRRTGRGIECEPVRCRREQSYIVRARLREGAEPRPGEFVLEHLDRDETRIESQRVLMQPIPRLPRGVQDDAAAAGELLGWFDTPKQADRLVLRLGEQCGAIAEIVLRPVTECPAVCHPAANLPSGEVVSAPADGAGATAAAHQNSTARQNKGAHENAGARQNAAVRAAHTRRVLLPASLSRLSAQLESRRLELLDAPASVEALIKRTRGTACVIDPQWIADLRMKWPDMMRLAEQAWIIVDLESAARLLAARGVGDLRLRHRGSSRELPCACVRYAGALTRGFALGDAFPYAVCSPGRFGVRFLTGGAAWRGYADEHGFATMLGLAGAGDSSRRMLCAAMPTAGGELIASDLPWLAAGLFGPLAAPRLARRLLDAQLAGPPEPRLQYWTPTREPKVLLREIAELQRHYPALLPVRWAGGRDGTIHLGLALRSPSANGTGRSLLIQTGRIDRLPGATSFPPEAMMSLMKLFARERRDATAWADEHLGAATIVWQFDMAGESQYRHVFDSAAPLAVHRPPRVLALVDGELGRAPAATIEGARSVHIDVPHGVLGDGSFDYQRELLSAILRELRGT